MQINLWLAVIAHWSRELTYTRLDAFIIIRGATVVRLSVSKVLACALRSVMMVARYLIKGLVGVIAAVNVVNTEETSSWAGFNVSEAKRFGCWLSATGRAQRHKRIYNCTFCPESDSGTIQRIIYNERAEPCL